MVFTFWEGKMPDYIKLCLETWKIEYVLLNYKNLHEYTDIQVNDNLKRYTFPQISDVVRAHVIRDNGGYWLDADTIMLSDKLPKENMIGAPENRTAHCGFLNFEKGAPMLVEWSAMQDRIIKLREGISFTGNSSWDLFANGLSDKCLAKYDDVVIGDRKNYIAESYMETDELLSNYGRYLKFYFEESYRVSDLIPTSILMLHNSWTPDCYKRLSKGSILDKDCTLSNILKEVLQWQ